MALNPKMHVTLTIEELEDIKNSAMERAEEMEWQLRVELQKIREIERNLSKILGEASQLTAAVTAPAVGRGTPLHGTTTPRAATGPTLVPKATAPIATVTTSATPAAPAATHVGPPPAPPAVPAPVAASSSKTVPTVRPSWSPPPPPVSTTSSTPGSVVRRLPPPPPPLPANVHRLNPVRKA